VSNYTESGLEKVCLSGSKRTNIDHEHGLDDWWVGHGKDESFPMGGSWEHLAILAAKILRHPNTQKVAPNLYTLGIHITDEQERNY
jgi:hypothetical protein